MTTYQYYKHIKTNSVKVLTNAGVSVKESLVLLKTNMPYLFNSKLVCDLYDKENKF